MAILLVRHGTAGRRSKWKGDDRERPLDKRGRRQASALVATLAGQPITRIVSSPFLRCVQTVEPLARDRGLPIEERDELVEGAPLGALVSLLRELGDEAPVICGHGDSIAELLGMKKRKAPKGSTWILERDGDGFAPAAHLPPPE